MKKTKILSSLLSLSLAASLAFPGALAMPARADGEPSSDNSGIIVDKTAEPDGKGGYTIQLEAYATGSTTTSTVTKDVPTDIVLVLDQSGSMDYDMGKAKYTKYDNKESTNAKNYEKRHNGGSGNLWYKLADNSYVSVSVTKTTQYTALDTNMPNWGYKKHNYWYYSENLYEKVGDEYKKVTPTRTGNFINGYTYTYTFADGAPVVSVGSDSVPDFGSRAPLYTPAADNADTVYTYTYTDAEGKTQTIGTSTGKGIQYNPPFYKQNIVDSGTFRIDALKTAAKGFVDEVAKKAAGKDGNIDTTVDNINHRIAVVGFASESGNGNNTELLSISGNNSDSVGVAYNSIKSQNLKDVLQSMDTIAGREMVGDALDALAAQGATRTDLGMDMAQRILNANPVPEGEKRNRIVIVFTDGAPTTSDGFDKTVANKAITTANAIKNSGATVYSIGIFAGADATSQGTEPKDDLRQNSTQLSAACNWFMQNLSSNNGSVRYPSYYLAASDAATLNNIFQNISQNITTGGSASTLDEKAVVKDIISPYFQLPEGADERNITLETYAYGTGGSWTNNNNTMGAKATVNGTGEVEVTGFNFSENWCGTKTENGVETPHGNKLVISFTVQPKPGFLGGNNVPTNTKANVTQTIDGVFHEFIFPLPKVNVPIPDITVEAQDKNVYLMGTVTDDDLKKDVTAKAGNVELKLDDPNYGLEDWQKEFVTITTDVKVEGDNLSGLKEDGKYTFEVKVEPKDTNGTATAQTGMNDPPAKINVFKPELTFKDSDVYYGDNAPVNPTGFTANKVSEQWKHGDDEAVSAQMTGEKPTLDITYTPAETKIKDGKINSKQDIPVKAEVKIGTENVNTYTTFKHDDCSVAGCTWGNPETLNGDPAFLLHVKTCQLTITKAGGTDGEPYVFTVNKDGQKYTEVTIVGSDSVTISELPVGEYTITEDTGWSWRYPTPSYTNNGSVTLNRDNHEGTITCTNKKNNEKWLNGFSEVVQNIFGQQSNTATRRAN